MGQRTSWTMRFYFAPVWTLQAFLYVVKAYLVVIKTMGGVPELMFTTTVGTLHTTDNLFSIYLTRND